MRKQKSLKNRPLLETPARAPLDGRPPANNFLFAGGPLANTFLFAGGPPANNLFQKKYKNCKTQTYQNQFQMAPPISGCMKDLETFDVKFHTKTTILCVFL